MPPAPPSPVPSAPLWRAIADALTADIAAGRYGTGARLPTEAQLSDRFGVNRHTVRRALAEMADQGLVHSRRGAGVFVAANPTDYPLGRRVRFHQNVAASGQIPTKTVLVLETRAADRREAEALDLAPGDPVHNFEGLSLADNHPMVLFRSVFPAARLPDLPVALRTDGAISRALAACGVPDFTRRWTRITAKLATPTQAVHLRLAPGDPILRTVALNDDPDGRPIEYGRSYFAGDRVTLTVDSAGLAPAGTPRTRTG